MNSKHAKTIILYVGVALLMTHELDAVLNREWLVLPLTSWMSSETGYLVFLWLHVPLFFAVFYFLSSASERTRDLTAVILSSILIVHAGLHLLFSGHEHYYFSSISSNLLIFGGAALGALFLLLRFQGDGKA